MTEHPPRLFASEADVAHVGEGMLARSLPRVEWTHEAHLATTAYLLLRRPKIDLDAELPDLIRRYNESVGGVNSDSEGYHETITRAFLHGVRLFLSGVDWGEPTYGSSLVVRCHRLRRKPLSRFTAEDLRIMIGQSISLPYLVPLAVELLEEDPLVAAHYFRGDLLSTVVRVGGPYWAANPDLLQRARRVVEAVGGLIPSLDENRGDAVIDLGQAEFVDSFGLTVLLNTQRRLARQGRALNVICGGGPVRRAIEFARLIEPLGVLPSLTEYELQRGSDY